MNICVAANEDGYGPSAFARYLVGGLLQQHRTMRPGEPARIHLLNRDALAYNRSLYADRDEVVVHPIHSAIRLTKRDGEVSLAETLSRLASYPRVRAAYLEAARPILKDCDLSIDIGVPLLARAAKRLGVRNVTVFDHSWSRTLRGLCSREVTYRRDPAPSAADREKAESIAREIERDEACTSRVYLFDRYITPPEFLDHWAALGHRPETLGGVLGGGTGKGAARRTLNELLAGLGQRGVSPEDRLILISPGGTAVWDETLPRLIDGYLNGGPREYVPVFSNPKARAEQKVRMRRHGGARWFEFLWGATQQAILPAFDLVVTRAGGGIVNDGLATDTPFVCVEERQWQVMLVERECRKMGLVPDLPETSLERFRADPARCVDRFAALGWRLPDIGVRKGVEHAIAEDLLGS